MCVGGGGRKRGNVGGELRVCVCVCEGGVGRKSVGLSWREGICVNELAEGASGDKNKRGNE